VKKLEAVFITHAETEHVGGLDSLRRDHDGVPVFGPGEAAGRNAPGTALGDGGTLNFGGIAVRVLRTPGHSEAHNCYRVSVPKLPGAPGLLVSGDLLFAGSIGGAYFCERRLTESVLRLLADTPETTVVAPGHGPLTTIKNERMFNPFVM
jgi:glyoxylase-like metal-dependent hydrolase (beta-lactamase superfamily II)